MKWNILSVVCVFVFVSYCTSLTINDTDTLHTTLLQNYNKRTRGTNNQLQPTVISVQFFITNINNFDERTGTFSIVGFFQFFWNDVRMIWNTTHYNGVHGINMFVSDVWVPGIVLGNANGQDGIQALGNEYEFVRFLPDGTAAWSAGNIFEAYCAPDITHYPFDKQV